MEIHHAKLEGKPLPEGVCYVLAGGEERLKISVLDRIREYALADSSGLDEETFDGKAAAANSILAAAQTIPFDAPRRLVVVRDAQRLPLDQAERLALAMGKPIKKRRGAAQDDEEPLPDSKPSKKRSKTADKTLLPPLTLPGFACLVLLCQHEGVDDADIQRRLQATSGLLETAAKEHAVLIQFPLLKGEEAVRRLRRTAEQSGKSLTHDAARHLLGLVDGDFGLAAAELEKAIHYTDPSSEINEFDLDTVVTPSRTARVFAMVDAIAEGRLRDALTQLRLMLAGAERPETVALRNVLPLLGRQFRLLWQARCLMDRGFPLNRTANVPQEIAAVLPDEPNLLSLLARQPYFEARFKKQAARFNLDQLREAFRLLLETDMSLKGIVPSLNANDSLERLVVGLCRLAHPSTGPG